MQLNTRTDSLNSTRCRIGSRCRASRNVAEMLSYFCLRAIRPSRDVRWFWKQDSDRTCSVFVFEWIRQTVPRGGSTNERTSSVACDRDDKNKLCNLLTTGKSQRKTRSQAVARIADRTVSEHLWGSRDHQIAHMPFSIGGPLERSLYLQPFSRYCALSVLGSRVWPFRVTWRHRSRDHLIAHAIFYWWFFGTKPLSLTVSEIFNVECNAMVDMTLTGPLNKGQGHSFWCQSISHIRLPIGCQ